MKKQRIIAALLTFAVSGTILLGADIPFAEREPDKTLCPPWMVISKGREAFNKFKVDGDSVTITLAANEMVLIQ